jgi:hypothetical protein
MHKVQKRIPYFYVIFSCVYRMRKLVFIFDMLLTLLLQAILILLWLHCMYLWCKMLKFLFSTPQEIQWFYESYSPPLDLILKQMIKCTLPSPFSLWNLHSLHLLSCPSYESFQRILCIHFLFVVCVLTCPTLAPPLILTFQEVMKSTYYEACLWTVSHVYATFIGP